MAAIRGRDTGPELAVRRILHRLGYRFRLHRRDLPGTPDIVLPRFRTAIFVHGCFWHRHPQCRFATTPRTRRDFWETKFRQNIERDERHLAEIRRLSWRPVVVWECELRNPEALACQLDGLLRGNCKCQSAGPAANAKLQSPGTHSGQG
jgi:DNA mismatch endonuclease (patch repair protein)